MCQEGAKRTIAVSIFCYDSKLPPQSRTRIFKPIKLLCESIQVMSDPASTQLVHEPAAGQQSSIPEWDQNAPSAKTEAGNNTAQTASTRPSLKDRFDSVVPQNRTYLGLSRQWFLTAVLCITLALLGLIIGLAVGLTRHHGSGGYVVHILCE